MYIRQLSSLFFSVALFALSANSLAQNKVVVVPLFDSAPTGVGAIPFYCPEVILTKGASEQDNVTCYRSDTRAVVTPVPAGQLMLITDIVARANALVDPGDSRTASIRYGRNSGGNFPVTPSHSIRVKLGELNHLRFSTPYVVLQGGELLGAYNGDVSTKGFTVNVSFSGYLIPATTFSN